MQNGVMRGLRASRLPEVDDRDWGHRGENPGVGKHRFLAVAAQYLRQVVKLDQVLNLHRVLNLHPVLSRDRKGAVLTSCWGELSQRDLRVLRNLCAPPEEDAAATNLNASLWVFSQCLRVSAVNNPSRGQLIGG
jgi:hypothetical protein